jgi:transcriptional regulator with XRE-family HTH domain
MKKERSDMPELNINKMKDLLKIKGYTYDDLAEKTNMSKSTISKIFGGFNTNPTLKFLREIAQVLDCSIDDFFDWEQEPTSPYYLDRKTAQLAQAIHDNPEYKLLMDATRDLKPEDLKAVIDIANRIKGNYNG